MDKNPPIVPADMSVTRFSDLIARGDPQLCWRQGALIVDDGGGLSGIITRGDVVRALQQKTVLTMTVLDAGKKEPIVTYPDEVLHDAISKMLAHDIGRLPVVERQNPRRIVGYLGRASIMAARARHIEEEDVRERGASSLELATGD
jgi:CBS domain-containing protein